MTTAPTELKPSAPAVGGVRVKPLDWLNNELNDATRARDYIIISGVKHFRLYRRVHNINGQESLGAFDTMAEAKAAAQAHHEAAILSALEPQAVDDAMVERTARALEAKLHLVHEHHRYKLVWEVAQSHLGPYDGPTYVEELGALTAALQAAKEPSHD